MKQKLLFLMLLTLLPFVGIQAQETYDLYICGTQVTSGNAGNVLGDGVFSYNAETQTLTVSGDCTYDQNYSIIQNDGIDGLVDNTYRSRCHHTENKHHLQGRWQTDVDQRPG